MSKLQGHRQVTRRQFLTKAAVTGLTIPLAIQMGPGTSRRAHATSAVLGSSIDLSGFDKPTQLQGALARLPLEPSRSIHLVNAHTGDDFNLVYFRKGRYEPDGVIHFNHLMRDRRANVATNMDTTLYDQLYMLRKVLETKRPIHVLSGYRTPATNAKLRKRSKRVAKYSLHMEGRAADIFMPGVSIKILQQAALEIASGGVGLYSSSHFIHIDTGPVRNWGG